VVEDFTLDLAAAVAYADERRGVPAKSSGVYAGADADGRQAWDDRVHAAMEKMMDRHLAVPDPADAR
jgi:hypothetical protein